MARHKSGKATVTTAGNRLAAKKLARLPMTNPRGKLFATASFCAHAAPVIAGAYRPLHAEGKKHRASRAHGKIIFQAGKRTFRPQPRASCHGGLADPLPIVPRASLEIDRV